MSLLDNKKNIFTTIGAYTSMQSSLGQNKKSINSNNSQNTFSSISNKDDIIPFLLDVLKVVVGTDALKQQVGELFTNFIDNVEPTLKSALKNQLIQYDAGNLISTTPFASGISVPVKNIDYAGLLKVNPNSDVGSLLYGATTNFNSKGYEAIVNAGTDVTYNNLNINYDATLDTFTLKPVTTNITIGDWLGNYVDDAVIIDKKSFLTNVMNSLYGSVSKKLNKSVEQTYQELQVQKLIEQLTENNDSFEISQADFDDLLNKAQELVDGVVYYDMGCGLLAAELPFSGMTNLIAQISGATDSFAVANAVDNTVTQSATNSETTAANKQTIRDGFFQRLIKILESLLIETITTAPQVRSLLAITSAIKNNGVAVLGNAVDDMKKFQVLIKCLANEAIKMISQFIFQLIVGFLIALLQPIIKQIIKEKINQYVGTIQSLTVGTAIT